VLRRSESRERSVEAARNFQFSAALGDVKMIGVFILVADRLSLQFQ